MRRKHDITAGRGASGTQAAAKDAAVGAAITAPRLVIENISPSVDGGRFAVKAIENQAVVVQATVFMDGHDQLAVHLLWKADGEIQWNRVPMEALPNDRWSAAFTPVHLGPHRFVVEAWLDRWGSYREELTKKIAAGVPTRLELEEGRLLIRAATLAKQPPAANALLHAAGEIADELTKADEARARELLLREPAALVMSALDERRFLTRSAEIAVYVDRRIAGFASWYELFPRSQSPHPGRHGRFDDVIARLPAIQAMGFDVLYFPPIHPIGRKHRKGRNNALQAGPEDLGSPYAIGAEEGGHEAVHPELGSIQDFRRLRDCAAEYGLEIALDFAIQCAPDHPWLTQHPGWFSWRPDGSVRYAENPPKKYEDIVSVDFYAADAKPALWLALRDVVQRWVDEGVRIFRVDNPHTKPLPFWSWLIADIHSRDPGVIFLAEAFTRPAMMYRLAKIGFAQSYTYFTWRNTKSELTEYLSELTTGAPRDFFRPNFFVNTPDINPPFLQRSGRPGFLIRAALACTLSGLWGLYSGFELCEGAALPGKEEYLDSEKYQLRQRDWATPGSIVHEISRLNRIRHEHPALHSHLGLKFHRADNGQVLFFSKASADLSSLLFVGISLDPHSGQHAHLDFPRGERGLPATGPLQVEELMRGLRFSWEGTRQHWYFDPGELPFAIWRIRPAGASR